LAEGNEATIKDLCLLFDIDDERVQKIRASFLIKQ
jgi:hypothetical protein